MATTKKAAGLEPDSTELLVKVCGMRDQENIAALARLQPDFIGFIFYEKSTRYAGKSLSVDYVHKLPANVKKIGVFVNEALQTILETAQKYTLQAVQLHGEELPEQCKQLRKQGYMVLKAFAVDDNFNFQIVEAYEGTCDYYLFDTKGKHYGGNGVTFDWSILNQYQLATPFFLSGGLDLEHKATIKAHRWPQFRGIDLNSRFEISPGLKDIAKLEQMIEACRTIKPMADK
jgi:phosphoribosylanthranilate isomerase